jgi:hypothetical protein
MFKKSFAFSLLAAGLIIAPGAAFAGVQNSNQTTGQSGAALGEANTVVNNANQSSNQDITKFKNGSCPSGGLDIQNSGQGAFQNGTAVGGANTVVNQANQGSAQNATNIASGYGYGCY